MRDDRRRSRRHIMSRRLAPGNPNTCPGGLCEGVADSGPRDVSLWFFTDRVQALYELLKARQLGLARATLSGNSDAEPDVHFEEDCHQCKLFDPSIGGNIWEKNLGTFNAT